MKTVLIVGVGNATAGPIAQKLKEDGHRVFLCDTREELERAQVQGSNVISADIYQESSVEQAVGEVVSKAGSLEVLVNNTMEVQPDSFEELSADRLRQSFRKAVIPAMLFTKAVMKLMEEKKIHGDIVNVSSDHAFVSDEEFFSASTVSWAMRGTTRAMAKQLSKLDIRVNACCVGDVPPEAAAEMVSFLTEGKIVDVTGQNIMVNDGRYMD